MRSGAERLRAAGRFYLGRRGAPTAEDRWFSLYLILFFAGFYVVPVAAVIGGFLDPGFASRLTAPGTAPHLIAGLTLLGAAAPWAGYVQGPAFLTPFLAHTLLTSSISRRRVLARPTVSTILAAGTILCACAAILLFALTRAGAWDWADFALLVFAAFLGGVHLGLLAFLGQRLSVSGLVLVSASVLALGAVDFLVPGASLTPAGWSAALWAGTSRWPVVVLTLTAAVGVVLLLTVPAALDRLPAGRVLAQSRRFSEARLFTSTGNINDAVELFRLRPAHRLQGTAVSSGPVMITGLRQDLVTVCRTPLSLLTAAMALPAGSGLLMLAVPAVGEGLSESRLIVTVPFALLGGLLVFFGAGSLTEGWRQVKDEFDAAPLYGWSPRSALLRRLLWPVLMTAVLTTAGGAGAVAFGLAEFSALWWTMGLCGLVLSARFFQSMRSRDIPVEFLAPTVIPGGIDLSAVKILVWLGDGVIVTLTGVLAAVVLPWDGSRIAAVVALLVLMCAVWGWARTGQPLLAGVPGHGR